MIRSSFAVAILLSSLAIATDRSVAEPIVLYDSGESVSMAPYLEPLKPKPTLLDEPADRPEFSVAGFGLPVRTPSMTPGKVQRRSMPTLGGKMVGASPLFIIGADQWSLQWVQQHRENLLQMGAAGMVVAAEKDQELEILRRAASGLPLFAASGEALAKLTGLRHYPALIAPPGVIVQ
ncbi:MAG: PFL_4695 family integrating conjugative element protein [Geminicoccales bacterium]